MLKKYLLILIFIPILIHAQSNKIVYMISPPRSLSVAFLRMMEVRGDFKVLHEPSQWAWCSIHEKDLMRASYHAKAFETFNEVKQAIFKLQQESCVFAKEMSFAVKGFLENDLDFVRNPDIHFVFLVRSPHHAIISFYKKLVKLTTNFNVPKLTNILGYRALYEILQTIKKHAVNQPIIILSEDLYNNPEETISSFCNQLGIPFLPQSLSWPNLGDNFDGFEQWLEGKYKDMTHHWHHDAIASIGFGKPSSYEVDEDGSPIFSEIENKEHRDQFIQMYKENLKYYDVIMKEEQYFIRKN